MMIQKCTSYGFYINMLQKDFEAYRAQASRVSDNHHTDIAINFEGEEKKFTLNEFLMKLGFNKSILKESELQQDNK